MRKYWVGIVSKEHVEKGVKNGFAQVCHGRKNALLKISKGDGFIYYSPKLHFNKEEKYQKFTAIGIVESGEIYQVQMTDDFFPYRLAINYFPCQDVSLYEVKDKLSFIQDNPSYGILFKRGLFEIPEADFYMLARSMGVIFDEEENQ